MINWLRQRFDGRSAEVELNPRMCFTFYDLPVFFRFYVFSNFFLRMLLAACLMHGPQKTHSNFEWIFVWKEKVRHPTWSVFIWISKSEKFCDTNQYGNAGPGHSGSNKEEMRIICNLARRKIPFIEILFLILCEVWIYCRRSNGMSQYNEYIPSIVQSELFFFICL